MNDGFPEAVILDQYMTVFDLPPDYEPDYLYNQIQSALNDCSLYGAGGVAGDVNGDAVVNVLDVVFTVNMILAGEFQAVADINIDSSVDVLDIVLIVIIILRG